jgi:hypothetical protein
MPLLLGVSCRGLEIEGERGTCCFDSGRELKENIQEKRLYQTTEIEVYWERQHFADDVVEGQDTKINRRKRLCPYSVSGERESEIDEIKRSKRCFLQNNNGGKNLKKDRNIK